MIVETLIETISINSQLTVTFPVIGTVRKEFRNQFIY
jgi:hypothetical protein